MQFNFRRIPHGRCTRDGYCDDLRFASNRFERDKGRSGRALRGKAKFPTAAVETYVTYSFLIPADVTRILIYGSARSNYRVTSYARASERIPFFGTVKNRSNEITIRFRERRFEVAFEIVIANVANKCR